MKAMIQATVWGTMALLGTMFASSASAQQHCYGNSVYRPLQPTPYSSYYGGGNYNNHHQHHHHQHHNYQPSYQHGGYGNYGGGYGYQQNYYAPNTNYRPYYGNQGGLGVYGAGGNGVYIRW